MAMNEMLEQVISRNDTWRGHYNYFQGDNASANNGCHGATGLSTGSSTLDNELQQGGWPLYGESAIAYNS